MVAPVTEAQARARGMAQTTGVVIEQVMPASPAFRAGLFDGDILLAVDGQVVDAQNTLTQRLADKQPGDQVRLRVLREGQRQPEDITITLGATTRDFSEGRPGAP
jgi:serine protease Do